jgi:hypothetical protein
MTRQPLDGREWLGDLIRSSDPMADYARELIYQLEEFEKMERNYRWVKDSLERHGYPLAHDYGFNVTGTVENLAATNLAVRSLTAEAGLIQTDDVKTDVVPLLRMFLPV